ncbi:minor histocompatibility antigen [Cryptosporidium ubiquitum]|uniref:Minor histocompatibility antigen n=1 Tax=Cryptosporidium ubiquitum TaxID=857276 RepID=A0A1J4MHP4_9CRYT|nr:minor histocompatibility antigen [Cryptosporidium ubiquitum]OII72979.1 minor histocompatibility antigen [Cryptosporidium ubiquitum]
MGQACCNKSLMAYYLSHLVLALAMLITHFKPLPIIIQMLMYTSSIIYIGSYLSLSQVIIDPKTGEKDRSTESLSRKDAMMFPVIGSVALFSLYLAYRFLPIYWVNLLLTSYLFLIGAVALMETILQFISIVIYKCDDICKETKIVVVDTHFNFFGYFENPDDPRGHEIKITIHHLWSLLLSLALGITWIATDSWIIHNIFAIAFCIQAISLISIGSFKIGAILLIGLFVYDIFWVFGTDVMVTVAKSFQGPAKLIFPVSFDPWKQSILGLGDIVIPGFFISLCLRFDLKDFTKKHNQSLYHLISSSPKAPTFSTVLVAYLLGLITTACVMLYFKAAQPALLYLVPFCLISMICSVVYRNKSTEAWNYSEEEGKSDDEKNDSKEGFKEDESQKNTSSNKKTQELKHGKSD